LRRIEGSPRLWRMLRAVVAMLLLGTPGVALAKSKVACIGASTTRGSGAPAGQSYPDQLGRLLGAEYEVRNFGLSSAGALKQGNPTYWNSAEFKAATAFAPDIVVDWLGGADSKVENWEPHKAEFLADYVALIKHFQDLPSHPRTIVLVSVALRDQDGVRKTVVENEINPLQRKGAADTGSAVVEVGMAVAGHPEYFADGVHLKATGYAEVAKAVQKVILTAPVSADGGAAPLADTGAPPDAALAPDASVPGDTAAVVMAPDTAPPAPRPTPDASKPEPEPDPEPATPTSKPAKGGCTMAGGGDAGVGIGLTLSLFALLRRRRPRS
jgi:lysophospholipase L1-like esterase